MTVQKETMQPAISFTVTTFSCCFKLKDFKIYCMYLYLLWVCFGWTVTSFSLNLPSLNHRGHKHNVTVYSNNLGGIRRTLSRSVFSFSPVGYRSCWRWTRPYLTREGAPLISSSVEITTTVNRNNGKQMFYFSTVEFWCQWNILLYTLCSNISLLFWMSSPSGNDSIHKTFPIKNDYTGFKTAPKDQNISDLYNNFWFNLLKLS